MSAASDTSSLSDSSLSDAPYTAESCATAQSVSEEDQTTMRAISDSHIDHKVSAIGHQVSNIERLCEKLRFAFDEPARQEDEEKDESGM